MVPPASNRKLRVLVIEPYYGGSHKYFLSTLFRLHFEFRLMSLPARYWKWRMRLSAPYFAQEIPKSDGLFDRILCSTYVDVATFRGMAPEWVRKVPVLTYFHENQFAYPVQVEDERDLHFGLTNMTTALASDSLAFNSAYNFASFLEGVEATIKHSRDLELHDPLSTIKSRSRVLPPGIDFVDVDDAPDVPRQDVAVIIWNHRWEYDKNPEMFFQTLFELVADGIDFRLIVLGESFQESPRVFEEAQKKLSSKIIYCGYPVTRQEYARWLRYGDIVVSTSRHEFFGIAVLEAIRAGCRPLLPRRLSYPELYPEEYLYDNENFKEKLMKRITEHERLPSEQSRRLTDRFAWQSLAPSYNAWISEAVIT